MNISNNPETLVLLQRFVDGFELTPEEHLKISATQPLPSWYEESLLRFVYFTKFSAADDPVQHWHLHFLRDRLSSVIFGDLISPLRDFDSLVTYADIRSLYLRKRRLSLLKRKVLGLQRLRKLALDQKQFWMK